MKKEFGPKKIDSLFERYRKTLKAPEATVETTAREVIDELLGITLASHQCRYKPHTRTLYIKHGLIKSEVLRHKQEVLSHLQGRLGERSAPTEIA